MPLEEAEQEQDDLLERFIAGSVEECEIVDAYGHLRNNSRYGHIIRPDEVTYIQSWGKGRLKTALQELTQGDPKDKCRMLATTLVHKLSIKGITSDVKAANLSLFRGIIKFKPPTNSFSGHHLDVRLSSGEMLYPYGRYYPLWDEHETQRFVDSEIPESTYEILCKLWDCGHQYEIAFFNRNGIYDKEGSCERMMDRQVRRGLVLTKALLKSGMSKKEIEHKMDLMGIRNKKFLVNIGFE